MQCAEPAFFESHGLDIGSFSSLTVKSRGHFRAGFDEWVRGPGNILEVDAAGLTSPDARALRVERLAPAGVAAGRCDAMVASPPIDRNPI